MNESEFGVPGMSRDGQGITHDWQFTGQVAIDGVQLKQVANVMTGYGVLTELYRSDWALDENGVGQVFQSLISTGCISGWHAHSETTDRLFVASGRMRIVLYDGRKASTTYRCVSEYRVGVERPALVVIPPGVWHAVENCGDTPAILVNMVDVPYRYENPDHYRLPIHSGEIPYRFSRARDALGGSQS